MTTLQLRHIRSEYKPDYCYNINNIALPEIVLVMLKVGDRAYWKNDVQGYGDVVVIR